MEDPETPADAAVLNERNRLRTLLRNLADALHAMDDPSYFPPRLGDALFAADKELNR